MKRFVERGDRRQSYLLPQSLDDYVAELPVAEFARYGTLLALKIGGHYLTVADKGPSFIIYPFDKYAELRSPTYYGRAVFQVATIDVI